MARNGSGTYSLPSGNPVTTGTTISSTVQNNTLSDIATALTYSLSKDGQTVPTANLPMGGFKFTGIGDGSLATDSVSLGQVADGLNGSGTSLEFTQTGTGAVARTWKSKVSESVSVKDFGAVGDGVTDDGSEIRSAAASFGVYGGKLNIGTGTYRIGASGGTCVPVSNPVTISGNGGIYTAINPSLATSSDDTITITPSASYDYTLIGFSGFSLHDPSTGNRTGDNGVYIDTQVAGANLPKFTLRDMHIGQGSGKGIYHLNNISNNVNGGLYASLWQNNSIKGGVFLENSGDSNSILHNTLTGTGYGVYASLTTGASLLEIQANNITATYGAIKIDAGSRYRIIGNNIEHSAAAAVANNNSAVVNINGANNTMYGGVIKENLISAFGSTDATTLLRIRNSRGILVEDNVFLSGGSPTTTGIDVGADCNSVRIGANTFNASVTTKVTDAGIGTMGVVKTPTLQNGWVAHAVGSSTLKYIKAVDGIVHVFGIIKDGTTANGTLIATLAEGFRPAETLRVPIMVVNAGTPQLAEMSVESTGELRINYVLSSNQLDINFSFPAANLADAVSLE